MTRGLRAVAVVVAVVSVAALLVAAWGGSEKTPLAGWLGYAWPVPNIVVGLLLTLRLPRLRTGWAFAAIGFLVSTGAASDVLANNGLSAEGGPTSWGIWAAWYGEWYWLPMIYATVVFVPLLFPGGRPPSPAWRRPTIASIIALAALTVTAALQEVLDTPSKLQVANPLGITGLGDIEDGIAGGFMAAVGIVSMLMALAALIVRYRRSRGVERQQLKWFTSACVALIVGFTLQGFADALGFPRLEIIDLTLFALPPIAAAVAIFRYRLYAIDRIISRTVTYAVVSALLVGVYLGAVAVMSLAIDPSAGKSSFAVAVATLAAAAAFRPARQRVQQAVDRRFNRARYDMQRTLDGFRERVRNDVDLDRLCSDLVAVTDTALQPVAAVVWLRGDEVSA